MRRRARRERGLSLLEICVAMAVLASASMGMAAGMMTGLSANRVYQQETLVLARAQHYLETTYNLQIGSSADAGATQAQLDAVFSGDPELGASPPSLVALAKTIDDRANDLYEFTPPNLGFPGTFLVRVTNNVEPAIDLPAAVDADGDGVPDAGGVSLVVGDLEEQFAGAGCYENDDDDDGRELFAIEISFRPAVPAEAAPRLVMRGFRAQDY